MDSPYHFCEKCWKINEIPADRFVANGFLLDVSKQCSKNRDYAVTVNDIKQFIRKVNITKYNKKHKYNVLLIRTGWGKFWNNKTAFLGTDDGDTRKFSFPGFSGEAAKYIVSLKLFVGVGIDTISLDIGKSTDHKAHTTFLPNQLYGLENLANLEKLPTADFSLYALPSKIEDATGSLTRVIAIVPSKN